jgi:hypothetical protein
MNDENPFVDENALEEDEQVICCWRNISRVCGPDCVAFDERSLNDGRFSACLLINNERTKSRALAALATIGHELKRQNDFYESDARKELEKANKKRVEAEAYAQKLKDLDKPPPEVKS